MRLSILTWACLATLVGASAKGQPADSPTVPPTLAPSTVTPQEPPPTSSSGYPVSAAPPNAGTFPEPTAPTTPVYPPAPTGYVYVPVPATPQANGSAPAPPYPTIVYVPNTEAQAYLPQDAQEQEPEPKRIYDRRTIAFGIAPLVLANVHLLDQPENRRVSVANTGGKVHGEDRQYPGFVGGDVALGVQFDVRYNGWLGAEIDVFYQNDRGRGTVESKDFGSICYVPVAGRVTNSTDYQMTIGQYAWHLPLLFKLSIPGSATEVEVEEEPARDHEVRHEPYGEQPQARTGNGPVHNARVQRQPKKPRILRVIRKSSTTFAFGPELVFPEEATLQIEPARLKYPMRAKASPYVMYTGSVGWERRLANSFDLRLLLSLRGSYNPGPKNSVQRRGEYAVRDGAVEPIAYYSEWRFQLAATLGLGWFF